MYCSSKPRLKLRTAPKCIKGHGYVYLQVTVAKDSAQWNGQKIYR